MKADGSAKTKSRSLARILWAVDPLTTDAAFLKSTAEALRLLAAREGGTVEPVFVWSQTALDLPDETESRLVREMQKQGQARLRRFAERVPGLASYHVLATPTSNAREEAHALVSYAKSVGASLIVVSSHGRKGAKRWLLGSFAETLSLQSEVPLFVVHPRAKVPPRYRSILFPTDFSDSSHAAFLRVIEFAATQGCQVTLFHKRNTPGVPVIDLALALHPEVAKAWSADLAEHRKVAPRWVAEGKRRGVRVQAVFERAPRLTLTEAILHRAETAGDDIIALGTEGSATGTWLLGSTARQVLRQAARPVWIVHPVLAKQPWLKLTWRDVEKDLFGTRVSLARHSHSG